MKKYRGHNNKLKLKKILFVGDLRSIHLQRYIKWFLDRYEIVCMTDYEVERFIFDKNKIKVYYKPQRIKLPIMRHLIQIYKLRKIIKKEKPDIINAHFITEDGWYAVFSGFHPVVLTGYGSDIYISPKNSWFYTLLHKLTFKYSDSIIVDSLDQKKEILKYRVKDSKIKVVQYGVDVEKYQKRNQKIITRLLSKYKIYKKQFIVLSMRNLYPIYNIDKIIKAFALFQKQVEDAILIVLGEGPEKNKLKQLAKKEKIVSKIKFCGFVDDPKPYIQFSDVMVSVPKSDGMPLSILEFMAAGKPVITSDLPSLKEIVENNKNGYRVDSTPTAISKAMMQLYRNKNLRKKMGKINMDLINNNFDYNTQMTKIENVFMRLINKK